MPTSIYQSAFSYINICHRSCDLDFLYPNKWVSNCLAFSKLATCCLYLCYILPSESLCHLQFCVDPTEKSAEISIHFNENTGEQHSEEGKPTKPPLLCPHGQQNNSQLPILVPSKGRPTTPKHSLEISAMPESRDTHKHPSLRHTPGQLCHFAQVSSLASSCVYSCALIWKCRTKSLEGKFTKWQRSSQDNQEKSENKFREVPCYYMFGHLLKFLVRIAAVAFIKAINTNWKNTGKAERKAT